MLRRFSYLFVMGSLVAMTVYLASPSNQAADPPAASKPNAPAVPPSPDEADPYAVPEGTDEKTLDLFISRITKMDPAEPTEAGIVTHFEKIDDAVSEILTRPISDDLFANVAQLRFQLVSLLGELQAKSASTREAAYLKLLSESPRPAAKALLERAQMQNRLMKFASEDPAAQQAMIDEVAKALTSLSADQVNELDLQTDVALDIGTILERANSPLTLAAYRTFSEALKTRNDPRLASVQQQLDRNILRLELPGKKIELVSKTLTEAPFDIKQYEGKVVLIDFWATWCEGCMQEVPEVEALYRAYHDKGLEIVGVNADEDREIALRFTKKRQIEWVNLHEEPRMPTELSPISSRFGISMYPTMILVDQTGKIVTVQIGGLHGNSGNTTIQAELEKLLGPPPQAATPSAPVETAPPAAK